MSCICGNCSILAKEIQGDNCDHGEVHLSNATSGIVNICINNMWITICGNGWDINDATVVCKSIGFNTTTGNVIFVCGTVTYNASR